MTEEQLKTMSEQQIRARFACAPAYYLQAKLDKKRALNAGATGEPADTEAETETNATAATPPQRQSESPLPEVEVVAIEPPVETQDFHQIPTTSESLDFALPGFEILDAALSESDSFRASQILSAEACPEPTQRAILESALEDYSNWPIRNESQLTAESELERKLAVVLDRAPELKLVLDDELELDHILEMEPELEVVLDSNHGRDPLLAPQLRDIPDNVTVADFGQRAPGTVPVVSVAMDRKRPNMVRVVGKTTRFAG